MVLGTWVTPRPLEVDLGDRMAPISFELYLGLTIPNWLLELEVIPILELVLATVMLLPLEVDRGIPLGVDGPLCWYAFVLAIPASVVDGMAPCLGCDRLS